MEQRLFSLALLGFAVVFYGAGGLAAAAEPRAQLWAGLRALKEIQPPGPGCFCDSRPIQKKNKAWSQLSVTFAQWPKVVLMPNPKSVGQDMASRRCALGWQGMQGCSSVSGRGKSGSQSILKLGPWKDFAF